MFGGARNDFLDLVITKLMCNFLGGRYLQEITRIEFGRESHGFIRGVVEDPDLAPWLCFSICTAERTFDFVAPTDKCAEK